MKVPPRVQSFIWCLSTNSLPSRKRTGERGIHCDTSCHFCADEAETTWQVFFICPRSLQVRRKSHLWEHIDAQISNRAGAKDQLFILLTTLEANHSKLFSMLLWSIWKSRNSKVWDSVLETTETVIMRVTMLLDQWQQVRTKPADQTLSNTVTDRVVRSKTPLGM